MTLIKISAKHSKLLLSSEYPIVLNPEKIYKLGVTNLLFSLDQTFRIKDFAFEFHIPTPNHSPIAIGL